MFKVMDKAMTVEFHNSRSRKTESGRLLAYEITGEACVEVKDGKVWIPFSRLTRASRKRVFNAVGEGYGLKKRTAREWTDFKFGIITTLMVLLGYFRLAF